MPEKKSLQTLVREKLDLLENSDGRLVAGISATEIAVYRSVLKILESLDIVDGKIVASQSNFNKLLSLKRELSRILKESTYSSKISKFIRDFDAIEDLSLQIGGQLSGVSTKSIKLTAEKKIAIDNIVERLLKPSSIDAQLRTPIAKLLFQHVTSGSSVSDAKESLRTFITGNKNRLGHLSRYVAVVSQTAISEYSGTVNQKLANELKLDGFLIVGSIIKTSRDNCKEMINGTGRFKELAVGKGLYRIADIPKIIQLAKNRGGWRSETTASNYLILKNGWNERHDFIPLRLTKGAIARANALTSKINF